MSTFINKPFRLNVGVDAYNPDVVVDQLSAFYLDNIEPRLGRSFLSTGYVQFQSLASQLAGSDKLVSFALYQLSTRDFVNFYVFSKTKAFWFDFSTGLFSTTAIYSSFPDTDEPFVILPWYDALYVTKFLSPIVKIERREVTVVEGNISARYGLVANSHLFLAGVHDGISSQLARTRWSDLDAPESLEIDTQASEADFFDLEPDSLEITGLSYQRSNVIIYARNTIWAASYIGFPGGFRHDPIFPGLGNVFHDAVVRGKELDYFIGPDNFYVLNGLQPVPIGDNIYERFIEDLADGTKSVRGYLDTRKNQVFWVYNSVAHDGPWSVVYNYQEKSWCERDAQELFGWFDAPRGQLRGYDAIDDVATMIDSDSDLIDDPNAGYPYTIPQLACCDQVTASPRTGGMLKLDGTLFDYKYETADFIFEDFTAVKEVHRANLMLIKSGNPDIFISIGLRNDQSDAIVWSDPIAMETQDGNTAFSFRAEGVGRFIRFRFTFDGDNLNFVRELRVLSIAKVEHDDTVTSK